MAIDASNLPATKSLDDLAARIRAEHEAAVAFIQRGLERAINCGALLIAAKTHIATLHGGSSHGHWLPWLHNECGFPERTAQAYMRLANHAAELSQIRNPADLTIDGALKLLAKPKPIEIAVADAAIIEAAADYLPTEVGVVRIGVFEDFGYHELVAVRADPRSPGYFQVAQVECHAGSSAEADDGAASWWEPPGGRPVRADWIKRVLQEVMRRPEHFDQFKWCDHDTWPFPEPAPRWPAWK